MRTERGQGSEDQAVSNREKGPSVLYPLNKIQSAVARVSSPLEPNTSSNRKAKNTAAFTHPKGVRSGNKGTGQKDAENGDSHPVLRSGRKMETSRAEVGDLLESPRTHGHAQPWSPRHCPPATHTLERSRGPSASQQSIVCYSSRGGNVPMEPVLQKSYFYNLYPEARSLSSWVGCSPSMLEVLVRFPAPPQRKILFQMCYCTGKETEATGEKIPEQTECILTCADSAEHSYGTQCQNHSVGHLIAPNWV